MNEEKYENFKVAFDIVIFTIHDNKLKLLLHVREKDPFLKKLELPGGLLLKDETADDSLKRKLKELIGQNTFFFKQFHTFTDPERDPRQRVISIGYISLVNILDVDDTTQWYDLNNINNLAFDHNKIALFARDYLKKNANSDIVRQFLPEMFPLNKLQEIYEILEQKKYDNRNFRKKILNSNIVEETELLEQNVSHRPAKLFKFLND
ncbi:hypothetical protein BVX95_02375 [archaeon D22]|nr:hypothetical protein BVX95_02375 [archaeon D22]